MGDPGAVAAEHYEPAPSSNAPQPRVVREQRYGEAVYAGPKDEPIEPPQPTAEEIERIATRVAAEEEAQRRVAEQEAAVEAKRRAAEEAANRRRRSQMPSVMGAASDVLHASLGEPPGNFLTFDKPRTGSAFISRAGVEREAWRELC
jgi:hypothetical protein